MNMIVNMLKHQCPRCRKGKLFTHSAYNFKHFTEMPEKCNCCEQPFELEPSFFYGAMYVSYALQVALLVTVFVAYQILYPEVEAHVMIITVVAIAFMLYPVLVRFSRSIWIHFFVKYDREAHKKCEH